MIQRYEHTEADLTQQLRQAREALASRTQELATIKSEWTSRVTEITNRHGQEASTEKEKAFQVSQARLWFEWILLETSINRE